MKRAVPMKGRPVCFTLKGKVNGKVVGLFDKMARAHSSSGGCHTKGFWARLLAKKCACAWKERVDQNSTVCFKIPKVKLQN